MSMKFMPERLRKLMDSIGISEDKVSVGSGIPTATIRQAFRLMDYDPRAKTLSSLAEYFQVPMEYFFDGFSEEEARDIYENYKETFKRIRKDAYEDYIIAGREEAKMFARKEKIEAPWPYNLIEDILDRPVNWLINDEQLINFEDTIKKVPYLEKYYDSHTVNYYKNEMTLEQVGILNGITRERARQIIKKSLRIMGHPRFARYLTGEYEELQKKKKSLEDDISELEQKKAKLIGEIEQAEIEKAKQEENKFIEVITPKYKEGTLGIPLKDVGITDLSVRAYNVLARSGCMTIGDVVDIVRSGKLRTLRNCGARTCAEVVKFLEDRGISLEVA